MTTDTRVHKTTRLRQTLAGGTATLLGVAVLGGILFLGFGGAGEAAEQGAVSNATVAASAASSSAAPSDAATMICSPSTRAGIASALGLSRSPIPTDDWRDQTYVCTYHLEQGPLVLTVKELPDDEAARREFDARANTLGPGAAIEGVASFGLLAFQSESGTVLFAKDNMTLEVDATMMTGTLGPGGLSQSELAYQVATNVLACWRAHHS